MLDWVKQKFKFQDAGQEASSGMGSSCDVTQSVGTGSPFPGSALYQNTPFGLTGYQYDQYWYNLYMARWEASKIVNIPADDMTREGWNWTSDSASPEKLKDLKDAEERLNLQLEINRALVYQRLYGGSMIFLGVKEDQSARESDPININKISTGDLAFVRAIPSFRVSNINLETDPLSPNYNRPEVYNINGRFVHRSRFLIFPGRYLEQPYFGQNMMFSRNNKLGFGESSLLCLYGEIQDAKGARQSVSHLLHKLSIMMFKSKGVRALRTTKRGNEIIDQLHEVMQMASNFRGVLMDENDSIENYSSNANVGEGLIIAFLQILSAASDIPATRFLGQAPGGLNATGESDLINYYDRLGAGQENELRPPLIYAGRILSRSVFGKEIDGLSVEFNSLWQPTDKEKADIRATDATTLATMVSSGIMLEEDAQKEALERGIVLNKLSEIEAPGDEPLDLGLPPLPGEEAEGINPGAGNADIRPRA